MAVYNSGYRLVGLETLRMGAVGGSGGIMGTTLNTLHNVVQGSAFLAFEAPGKIELYNEDSDIADILIQTPGAKFVEFSVRDMDEFYFQLAFGGSTSGTTWSMAQTAVGSIEKSLQIISKDYGADKVRFDIPRVCVRGSGDLKFTKTDSGVITFTCDIMMPETLTPPIKMFIV